jgi:hypothetical protein
MAASAKQMDRRNSPALRALAALLIFSSVAWMGTHGGAVSAAPRSTTRSVQGRVIDANDAPIRSAIVYLNDDRTKEVQSYITQEDGAYRFQQLSPNDDYKLWAQANGKKSKTKILSSFDDRSDFHVILRIGAAK